DRRQPEDADAARRVGERRDHGVRFVSGRWALGPEVKRGALAGGAMLYDTSRVGNLSGEWFEPRYWQARGGLEGAALGRAATFFTRSGGARYVLRHYRRGGLLGSLSGARYAWRGEEHPRPFLEWQLTYTLHRAGLPVPVPLGARYRRKGALYTGD